MLTDCVYNNTKLLCLFDVGIVVLTNRAYNEPLKYLWKLILP